MSAYQSNGGIVPNNYILTVSTKGAAVFSNTINPDFINASTIIASTVSAQNIDVDVLSTNMHYTSSISTNIIIVSNYIQSVSTYTSTLVASTIANSNLSSMNIYTDFLETNNLQVNADANIDGNLTVIGMLDAHNAAITMSTISTNQLTVASTTWTSSLSTNIISSNILISNDISTLDALTFVDNNNSTLVVDSVGSTLYVGGFPVITEGNISSISSLYWEDDMGGPTPLSGGIFNKNLGQGDQYYMVGIGTGSTLNATLDVLYTGTGTGNAFNVSSNNNRFTITNTSSGTSNYMGVFINNDQNNTFGSAIHFNKSQAFNSTVSSCELGFIDFNGMNNNFSTVRGALILARQTGPVSTFTAADLEFMTCTSSGGTTQMVITSQGNVGIGTTMPSSLLHVNGTALTSTLLANYRIGAGTLGPSSLLQVGNNSGLSFYTSTNIQSTIIYGPQVTPSTTTNPSSLVNNFNFQSALLVAHPSTQSTNVGTGIALGGRQIYGGGEITAFARVSGVASDGNIEGDFTVETLLQTSGSTAGLIERMRIKNTGYVGIGLSNPSSLLDVAGTTHTLTLNTSTLHASTINGSTINTSTLTVSTINGVPYMPSDDAFWSLNGSSVYNDNPGYVGIGTITPSAILQVDGTTYTNAPSTSIIGVVVANISSMSISTITGVSIQALDNSNQYGVVNGLSIDNLQSMSNLIGTANGLSVTNIAGKMLAAGLNMSTVFSPSGEAVGILANNINGYTTTYGANMYNISSSNGSAYGIDITGISAYTNATGINVTNLLATDIIGSTIGINITNLSSLNTVAYGLVVNNATSYYSTTGISISNISTFGGPTYGMSIEGLSAQSDCAGIRISTTITDGNAYGINIRNTSTTISTSAAYGLYLDRGTKSPVMGGQLLKVLNGNLGLSVVGYSSNSIISQDAGNIIMLNPGVTSMTFQNTPTGTENGTWYFVFNNTGGTITFTDSSARIIDTSTTYTLSTPTAIFAYWVTQWYARGW